MTYPYHEIIIELDHNFKILIESWFDLGQHFFVLYILHTHIF
jgi:hypothetical protein